MLRCLLKTFWILIVVRARPGGLPFAADSRRVSITIKRVEAMRGKLVSVSANWIMRLGTVAIEFLIQQWRRINSKVGRQYRTP